MRISKSIIFLFISIFLLIQKLDAETCLPTTRRVDWKKAGLLPDTDFSVDNWIYIDDYSGTDYEKIMSAISDANNQSGNSIIYFQSPDYHINSTINGTHCLGSKICIHIILLFLQF